MNQQLVSFDSGTRSDTNGLPTIQDINSYLQHLLASAPNETYTRHELMEAVALEFKIPTHLQLATAGSKTPLFNTRMNYIIAEAVTGEREDHKPGSAIIFPPFAKRVGLGVYQHISGNGKYEDGYRAKKPKRLSRKLIGEAKVSVKILKDLKWEPERIMLELHQWSDDIIEAAINEVFSVAA